MDPLTTTQHIKIIKTYSKNGDGRRTAIFRTKFSSAIKHISHSVDILISKIVVFGVLRILNELKICHYIQKKPLFGALFHPIERMAKVPPNMCQEVVENYLKRINYLGSLPVEVI